MGLTKLVLFKINDQLYGIDIEQVNAIETATNITASPNMPDFMLGMINLRGSVIPIVSLRKKFAIPEIPVDAKTQYLIILRDGECIGFKVDEVKEIVEVSDENIHKLPTIVKSEDTGYANNIAAVDGNLVVIINTEGVLTDKESENISNAINAVQ